MSAIFKRELRAYFTGPIAYIFCAAFIAIAGILFYSNNVLTYKSDFFSMFFLMLIVMIFIVPLMTMRLWSDERRQKTDQLLLTAPVSTMSIVLGKFFAAMTVFLTALGMTLIFTAIVGIYGTLAIGKTIGNYIAITLAASAYIAISLFMSSLTESQIVAAILSFFSLLTFWLAELLFGATEEPIVNSILSFFSMTLRYTNFFNGLFPLADILYFISLTVLFLFLTSRAIEKRRWG